jgi:hypothetical protein
MKKASKENSQNYIPTALVSLTDSQAVQLIATMEQAATDAPALEFTSESWKAEFGEEEKMQTPIGEVKMGENQQAKLILNKRTAEFGMIKPTITNPDVIIEVPSEAKKRQNTERPSSYLFVKSFIRIGQKIRHFETVTVSKEGMEVAVSSHIVKPAQLMDRLTSGKILWSRHELSGADASGKHQTLDEHATQNPNGNVHGSNAQSTSTSVDKGRNNS